MVDNSTLMSLISSLSMILVSSLLVVIGVGSVPPPNMQIPALIGFGDSIIDPGNNNDILTIIKCNFPPYGQDFPNSIPTGRFSNGRIITDFIADDWGLKPNLPAYLNPNLKPEDLLTGVSFASGSAGYDPITSTTANVIPLSKQLNMYKEYISKLRTLVGSERTDFIISNGVHLVVSGSNDIANNYFGLLTPLTKIQYSLDSYADRMLTYASSFVKELYGLGARRIVVFGAPPIGCVPIARTLGGGPTRKCAGDYNKLAQIFNSKLIFKLNSLQSSLPNSNIVYVDIYHPILDMIQFPSKYGFEEVTRGCCGTGLVELGILCNELDPVCPDNTKYMFWDGAHPTEKASQIIVSILNNYIPALV